MSEKWPGQFQGHKTAGEGQRVWLGRSYGPQGPYGFQGSLIPSAPEALVSLEAFMALEVFKPVRALPQASGPFVEALKILRSLERLISFCASDMASEFGPGVGGWGVRDGRGGCRMGVGAAGWS